MDKSAVSAIIEAQGADIATTLGLQAWRLGFNVDLSEPDGEDGTRTLGSATTLIDYNVATINLNPNQFDDAEGVLAAMRHEFYHILLSPIDLYHEAVQLATEDADDAVTRILERTFTHAIEQTVIAVERMYSGLTHAEKSQGHPGPEDGERGGSSSVPALPSDGVA